MPLQFRKVTEEDRLQSDFIPFRGEPVLELFTNRLFVGDGETIGGVSVLNGIQFSDILGIPVNYTTIKDRSHIYWSDSSNSWEIGLPSKNLSSIIGSSAINGDYLIVRDEAPYAVMDPFATFNANLNDNICDALYVASEPTQAKWFIWSGNRFVASNIPSALSINQLPDVETSNRLKGDVLVYDSGLQLWINKKIFVDPASSNFVYTSSLSNKQFLRYDGPNTRWTNKTFSFFEVSEIADANPIPADNGLFYNSLTSKFELRTIDLSLNDLPEVNVVPDESGVIDNGQVVAYDLASQKWITPPDRVIGVTTGLGYSRRVRKEEEVRLGQDCQCLGSFDLPLEGDSSANSITIDGKSNRKYDVAFFDTEEDRQAFLDSIDCTICDAGQSGNFQNQAESNGGSYMEAESGETKRSGDATEEGREEELVQDLGGEEGEEGEGGGEGPDAQLPPGSGGSGKIDPGGGGGGGGGSGGKGGFRKGKKGVVLSRDKTTDVGDGGETIINIEVSGSDYNEPSSPLILGYDTINDTYGYYYKYLQTRKQDITLDPSYQSIFTQSKMRRCGCIVKKTTGFQVVYYNDADDSTKLAGDWIRIVERQVHATDYAGDITEQPSTILRDQIPQYRAGAYYYKGNRVIYNNKLWECLVKQTQSVPAPGTITKPVTFNGDPIWEFVEIPAFRIWSQLVGDITQTELLVGKVSTTNSFDYYDNKIVHPAFLFDESGDLSDYLYVAVNLSTGNDINNGSIIHTNGINPAGRNVYLASRSEHRSSLDALELDPGFFLYDYNVHSAIQALMYTEFQDLNIEKYLGESNNVSTDIQTVAEINFANDIGNGSGMTQSINSYGSPAGIVNYRGIFRPYGNQGYFIDGINVNDKNRTVYAGKDPVYYSESFNRPITFEYVGNFPSVTLTNGTGYSFWKGRYYSPINSSYFGDFEAAYYTPYTIDQSASRLNYFGDIVSYRAVTTNKNIPLVVSVGKPYTAPFNDVNGGYGPFGYTLSNSTGTDNRFARRYCIKRKGPTKDTSLLGGSIPPGTNGVRTVGLRRVDKIEANVYIGIIESDSLSGSSLNGQVNNAIRNSYLSLIQNRPESRICMILHDFVDKNLLDGSTSYPKPYPMPSPPTQAAMDAINGARPDKPCAGLSFFTGSIGIFPTFYALPGSTPLDYQEAMPFTDPTDIINGEPMSLVYNNINFPYTRTYRLYYGLCLPDFMTEGTGLDNVTNRMYGDFYIDDILCASMTFTKADFSNGVNYTFIDLPFNAGNHKIEIRIKIEFNPANFPEDSLNRSAGWVGLVIKDLLNGVENQTHFGTGWGASKVLGNVDYAYSRDYRYPTFNTLGVAEAYRGFRTDQLVFDVKPTYYSGITTVSLGFHTDWFKELNLGALPPGTKIAIARKNFGTSYVNSWPAWQTFVTKCQNAGFILTTKFISTSTSDPNYLNWVNAVSGY